MHGFALAASRGALVVKELKINENGPVYVRIVGRRGGLISWLLSLIGIDPTTEMEVTEKKIEFIEGSLSGQLRHMVPLRSVCNLGAGYFKPFVLIVVAVILLLLALVASFQDVPGIVVFLLFASTIGCAIAYFLKKTLLLFALPGSGFGPIIGFKRSVIEGVSVDEKQAMKIVEIVTALINAQNR